MKKKIKNTLLYTFLFALILFMLGAAVNIFMMAWAQKYIITHNNLDALPEDFTPDCILVLGAKVIDDNTMSKILSDRVDAGLMVYEHYSGNVPLLLSGGDKPGQNEINAMSVYAFAKGAKEDLVLTDGKGVNTRASMARAKEIFNAKKMIVVTQDFHMARSLFLARSMGLEAYGVTSDFRMYYPRNYIREYFARIKDMLLVMSGNI
ncbi:MAG: YdcF family protein [Ruminococcaceae bacterium]|nr:YdcF family protein [Oscillospiraceae bacterium]